MIIEIGKKYVDVDGNVIYITGKYTNSRIDYFIGVVTWKGNPSNQTISQFLKDGKYSGYQKSSYNLVAEYRDPVKAEMWAVLNPRTGELYSVQKKEINPSGLGGGYQIVKVKVEEIRD